MDGGWIDRFVLKKKIKYDILCKLIFIFNNKVWKGDYYNMKNLGLK